VRRHGAAAAELAETRRDLFKESEWGSVQDEMLERRVAALEALVAARWPARISLRRRLARDLRASVRGYGWVGPEWFWRRAQAVSDEMGAQR
jgi:hypothetical protein